MFSTDPSAPKQFVSDASWYCQGYQETPGVAQEDWPKLDNAYSFINAAMSGNNYTKWTSAVELSPNYSFEWGTQESIPLQSKYVWAAGVEKNKPENPPRNIICVKEVSLRQVV